MPNTAKKRNRKIIAKLFLNYRLVIMSDENFEEKVSFRLNRANVLFTLILFSVFLIVGTSLVLAYSPLKEFLPGVVSKNLRQDMYQIQIRMDSVNKKMRTNQVYIENIEKILKDDFSLNQRDSISRKAVMENPNDLSETNFYIAPKETDFVKRITKKIEDSRTHNRFSQQDLDENIFAPLDQFTIQNHYRYGTQFLGTGFKTEPEATVYAISKGKIMHISWDSKQKFTLLLAHPNGWTSIYRNLKSVHGKVGDIVSGHEPIAKVGNHSATDKLLGGYLELQMWYYGDNLDPENYLDL